MKSGVHNLYSAKIPCLTFKEQCTFSFTSSLKSQTKLIVRHVMRYKRTKTRKILGINRAPEFTTIYL